MVNPGRFTATISAVRALEATLIVLEELDIAYDYIDSKGWQKDLLPLGLKSSDQQKKASAEVGIRMFPQFKELITKHKDADGILIAEWARRNKL
jgi:ribosome biogenesis protein Tsr3